MENEREQRSELIEQDTNDSSSSHPKARIHKPWWRNALGWLISEEIGDIKKDIVFPALRDVVYNVITVVIFGEPKSRRNTYNDYSSRSDFRSDRYSRDYSTRDYSSREDRKTSVSDYKYVSFKNMYDAEMAIDDIRIHARKYGKVSVAKYWDILRKYGINRDGNPIEEHWGWYPEMLENVRPRRNYEGEVVLMFPEEPKYF